jgi:SAM-dependent methyltransferase
MAFFLEKVVPWGRSLAEYRGMFDLTPTDLERRILDCGGGPASFSAELTQQGGQVCACDPIYQCSQGAIAQRIAETYPIILERVAANQADYVWTTVHSPAELGQVRRQAMDQFLADFPTGLATGRYQVGELPHLPFPDQSFDLALCGHLLFSYSDQLSEEFHLAAVQDLCRVAGEVRIFPVVTLAGDPAPALSPVIAWCAETGRQARLQTVPYEFQRGGNQMLRIF